MLVFLKSFSANAQECLLFREERVQLRRQRRLARLANLRSSVRSFQMRFGAPLLSRVFLVNSGGFGRIAFFVASIDAAVAYYNLLFLDLAESSFIFAIVDLIVSAFEPCCS